MNRSSYKIGQPLSTYYMTLILMALYLIRYEIDIVLLIDTKRIDFKVDNIVYYRIGSESLD
jgi:hypothetical protein